MAEENQGQGSGQTAQRPPRVTDLVFVRADASDKFKGPPLAGMVIAVIQQASGPPRYNVAAWGPESTHAHFRKAMPYLAPQEAAYPDEPFIEWPHD